MSANYIHHIIKNDEVKLLNLFTLSGKFNANDVTLIVNSGLLPILEKFCNSSNPDFDGITHQVCGTHPKYVTMASARLLHMIAGATA
jgi:hypothetical protein